MRKSEFWISWRYFLGGNKERFVSIISVFSILGVAVGVAALIIVLAVMSGFDNDLRDKIVGSNAHLVVSDNFGIMFYNDLQENIESVPGVVATAPHVNTQGFIRTETAIISLYLRGILPQEEVKVTKLKKYLIAGDFNSLDTDENAIIIGEELAGVLGLYVGDEVELISPTIKDIIKFKVAGIFKSGMYNYDLTLAFISLARAQELNNVFNVASGIGVRVDNLFAADKVKKDILFKLGTSYNVRTWAELNKTFFDALKLEKFTMFIILSLIVLVASFGIASTLIVRVTEKIKDIGILKSIGVTRSGIRNIFILQGAFIGIAGIVSGIIFGVGICLILKKYQFIKLPDLYYLDRLPVYLSWQDISCVSIAALLITLIATVYPASRAANLNITEALRYE